MTEAELKAKVVEMAHRYGWMVFSNAMVKAARPVKGASGYPDLTMARDRRVVWIELKRQDGVLSPQQMAWLHELPNMHVIRPSDLETDVLWHVLR